jgi:hypothetical protein
VINGRNKHSLVKARSEGTGAVFDGTSILPHRLHDQVVEEADSWIAAGYKSLTVFFVAGHA